MTSQPPASPRRVPLKSPWVAAVLAWLVPGLGHLYQGRTFKAALYSVCILSTYFSGLALGGGKVVYFEWQPEWRTYGYLAQVMTGLPAVPALVQTYRSQQIYLSRQSGPLPRRLTKYQNPFYTRSLHELQTPLKGHFTGIFDGRTADMQDVRLEVAGEIEIVPRPKGHMNHQLVEGRFTGTARKAVTDDGSVNAFLQPQQIELVLNSLGEVEPEVFPSPNREVELQVRGSRLLSNGTLTGSVEGVRGFFNRYTAPLDDDGLRAAHAGLGKLFELGQLFTWIAGLLNVLAIWDALEGPAYGWSDEEDEEPSPAPPPTPT